MRHCSIGAQTKQKTTRNQCGAVRYQPMFMSVGLAATALVSVMSAITVHAQGMATPVPGYVPPVTQTRAPDYVDDTRGVFIPQHVQYRLKTEAELQDGGPTLTGAAASFTGQGGYGMESDTTRELERIAQDPGLLSGGGVNAGAYAAMDGRQMAQNTAPAGRSSMGLESFPSLATGGQARVGGQPAMNGAGNAAGNAGYTDLGVAGGSGGFSAAGDGREIAISGRPSAGNGALDMQNSIVRLKEDRITVRRALQRMMDQIGGGSWTVVWDLDEQNAGLPDMEISISAEEPFINVLNALLGRLQSRSGDPLRVVRYDKTQRLVISDRSGSEARSATAGLAKTDSGNIAVTETVLKESLVSLHYDEIPLVDALENVINQAGKGQWRLRMYAGTDQVIKPAHIEEPLGVALERILKIFNLRYEIFPGGKLIVVTSGDRFGFRGVE